MFKANYRAANGSAGGEVGSHPGSHNMGYVMRANSSALTLRLVWQSSLATLPFLRSVFMADQRPNCAGLGDTLVLYSIPLGQEEATREIGKRRSEKWASYSTNTARSRSGTARPADVLPSTHTMRHHIA